MPAFSSDIMRIYRIALREDIREGWAEPSTEDYIRAFSGLPEWASKLLKIQFSAVGQGISTAQMSNLAEFKHDSVANLRYGEACKLVSKALGVLPACWSEDTSNWWSIVSEGCEELREFLWVMRLNAVAACKQLGWETSDVGLYYGPAEGGTEKEYFEGRTILVPVTIHERDKAARLECIKYFGSWKCQICDLDFFALYGEIGKEFIHVHHLTPVCEREGRYKIDPQTELLPVCPNCHAMLHRRTPSYAPDELRKFIKIRTKP